MTFSTLQEKCFANRWSGDSVVRFLAFGAKGGYFRSQILKTLDEEFPQWKTEFAWEVLIWEVEELL